MGKFWHQNQTPSQYFEVWSRGQAVEDFMRSLAHPKGLTVRNHPPELNLTLLIHPLTWNILP
jgi:hypothetical protein